MQQTRIAKLENEILNWMAKNGITLLRISIGIIFLWFGFQKFFPGISSAEDIATRTIDVISLGVVKSPFSMPILATWETLIGLGFLTGKFMRATFILMILQMAGTLFPLLVFPQETFHFPPFVPSLEGQYILKNIIIITGAMVILAHSRGKIISKENNK
ncbi:MAG: DoxX family protein [Bacteroidales bacterium]